MFEINVHGFDLAFHWMIAGSSACFGWHLVDALWERWDPFGQYEEDKPHA